jgi:hypothetical protein
MKQPTTLLQGKPWIPSCATDVQATWREHGWKPTKRDVAPVDVRDSYGRVDQDHHLSMIGGFKP